MTTFADIVFVWVFQLFLFMGIQFSTIIIFMLYMDRKQLSALFLGFYSLFSGLFGITYLTGHLIDIVQGYTAYTQSAIALSYIFAHISLIFLVFFFSEIFLNGDFRVATIIGGISMGLILNIVVKGSSFTNASISFHRFILIHLVLFNVISVIMLNKFFNEVRTTTRREYRVRLVLYLFHWITSPLGYTLCYINYYIFLQSGNLVTIYLLMSMAISLPGMICGTLSNLSRTRMLQLADTTFFSTILKVLHL